MKLLKLMILRRSDEEIILSECRALFACRDTLEAELCACMKGLSFALHRSDLPVVIEMDLLIAFFMITSSKVDRSVYASLVNEIRYLILFY